MSFGLGTCPACGGELLDIRTNGRMCSHVVDGRECPGTGQMAVEEEPAPT